MAFTVTVLTIRSPGGNVLIEDNVPTEERARQVCVDAVRFGAWEIESGASGGNRFCTPNNIQWAQYAEV